MSIENHLYDLRDSLTEAWKSPTQEKKQKVARLLESLDSLSGYSEASLRDLTSFCHEVKSLDADIAQKGSSLVARKINELLHPQQRTVHRDERRVVNQQVKLATLLIDHFYDYELVLQAIRQLELYVNLYPVFEKAVEISITALDYRHFLVAVKHAPHFFSDYILPYLSVFDKVRDMGVFLHKIYQINEADRRNFMSSLAPILSQVENASDLIYIVESANRFPSLSDFLQFRESLFQNVQIFRQEGSFARLTLALSDLRQEEVRAYLVFLSEVKSTFYSEMNLTDAAIIVELLLIYPQEGLFEIARENLAFLSTLQAEGFHQRDLLPFVHYAQIHAHDLIRQNLLVLKPYYQRGLPVSLDLLYSEYVDLPEGLQTLFLPLLEKIEYVEISSQLLKDIAEELELLVEQVGEEHIPKISYVITLPWHFESLIQFSDVITALDGLKVFEFQIQSYSLPDLQNRVKAQIMSLEEIAEAPVECLLDHHEQFDIDPGSPQYRRLALMQEGQ